MKETAIKMKRTTNPSRSGFVSFNGEDMTSYIKKVNSFKSLNSDEEKEIARLAKSGD